MRSKLKGIIIIEFNENSEATINTQFPINVMEFLKLSPQLLEDLSDQHMKRKMEPNYLEFSLEEDVNVASFYSGFSFRHYVGTPNFAITVFLSENDKIPPEFEGMMRRIAHELLPKRDALNFDDILGRYYEMLKSDELSPFWEEIIEGETSTLKREEVKLEEPEVKSKDEVGEMSSEPQISDKNIEVEDLKAKNKESLTLLEEKKTKIRELTRKYADLTEENTKHIEELDSLKNEISEQYIKLEKWNQQMAELNENNAKLLDDIKALTDQLSEKDGLIYEKDNEISKLKNELLDTGNIENEAEKLLQELEDLRTINKSLNSENESLELKTTDLLTQIKNSRNSEKHYMNSITNLKIELKKIKDKTSMKDEEKDKLNSQIFDLKKEIKVLRRERDHYLKLVKENGLL
jgi:hypothetical protein